MRVLHLVSRAQRRGAETVALEIADELNLLGVTNRLLALGPNDSGENEPRFRVLSRRTEIRGLAVPMLAMALRREIVACTPDVILAHGGQPALVASLATIGGGPPVVWQRILELPAKSALALVPWRFVASRVAGVFAISDRVGREVRDLGFAGPVWRVKNCRRVARFEGIDHRAERVRLRASCGLPPEALVIGFVGHMVEQKRPERAVEVLSIVRSEGVEAHLVMVGDGPRAGVVRERVAASGFDQHVSMQGHRSDIPSVLAAFDVLLITSQSETATGTVIEAQMSALPVVSFSLDGMDELIEDGRTGIIIPEQSPQKMAKEVSALLRDDARRAAMSDAAGLHGRRFSTEEVAKTYRDALRGLVDWRRRPRVLYLMPNFGVGGAEQALLVIAKMGDRSAFEPMVASLRSPRRPESETVLPALRALGVPTFDLAVAKRADQSLVALASAAARLRKLCREERVDIVDSALFEADITTRVALLGTRIRHCVHLVSTPYDDAVLTTGVSRVSLRAVQAIDTVTAPLTDGFVAITGAAAVAAHRDLHISDRRITMISRGVVLDEFPPQPPAPPSDVVRFLTVGRMVPNKAHGVAMAAIRKLLDRGLRVSLTIAGEGPLRGALEAQVRDLALDKHVTLLMPTKEIAALHRAHDAFCFPSLLEGQGNALIEAMACARAVVASEIPSTLEVLGGLGITTKVGDVDSLSDGMERIVMLGQEGRRAMGAQLRERACLAYDARARVDELVRYYCSMLRC